MGQTASTEESVPVEQCYSPTKALPPHMDPPVAAVPFESNSTAKSNSSTPRNFNGLARGNGSTTHSTAQSSQSQSWYLINAGRYRDAITALKVSLKELQEIEFSNGDAYNANRGTMLILSNLGFCYAKLQEFAQAREYYLEAKSLLAEKDASSSAIEILFALAWCEHRCTSYETAIELYQDVLTKTKNAKVSALFFMGEACYECGDYEMAISILKQYLEKEERSEGRTLSSSLGSSRNSRNNCGHFGVNVKRDNQVPQAYKILAQCYEALGDSEATVQTYEMLLRKIDEDPNLLDNKPGIPAGFERAIRLEVVGILRDRVMNMSTNNVLSHSTTPVSIHEHYAIRHLTRILQKNPDDYLVLRQLCFCSRKLKDVIQYGEKAYALNKCPELAYHLGQMFERAIAKHVEGVSDDAGAGRGNQVGNLSSSQLSTPTSPGVSPMDPTVIKGIRNAAKWYRNGCVSSQYEHLPSMLAYCQMLINFDMLDDVLDVHMSTTTSNNPINNTQSGMSNIDKSARRLDGDGDDKNSQKPGSQKTIGSHSAGSRGSGARAGSRFSEAMEILSHARKMEPNRTAQEGSQHKTQILELSCICKYRMGNYFASRGYAQEIRRIDPYNRTALFVLCEIQKVQKYSVVGSKDGTEWWVKEFNVDTDSEGPRARERLLLNICEAYRGRKRFADAEVWLARSIQTCPGSMKLKNLKLEMEREKKSWKEEQRQKRDGAVLLGLSMLEECSEENSSEENSVEEDVQETCEEHTCEEDCEEKHVETVKKLNVERREISGIVKDRGVSLEGKDSIGKEHPTIKRHISASKENPAYMEAKDVDENLDLTHSCMTQDRHSTITSRQTCDDFGIPEGDDLGVSVAIERMDSVTTGRSGNQSGRSGNHSASTVKNGKPFGNLCGKDSSKESSPYDSANENLSTSDDKLRRRSHHPRHESIIIERRKSVQTRLETLSIEEEGLQEETPNLAATVATEELHCADEFSNDEDAYYYGGSRSTTAAERSDYHKYMSLVGSALISEDIALVQESAEELKKGGELALAVRIYKHLCDLVSGVNTPSTSDGDSNEACILNEKVGVEIVPTASGHATTKAHILTNAQLQLAELLLYFYDHALEAIDVPKLKKEKKDGGKKEGDTMVQPMVQQLSIIRVAKKYMADIESYMCSAEGNLHRFLNFDKRYYLVSRGRRNDGSNCCPLSEDQDVDEYLKSTFLTLTAHVIYRNGVFESLSKGHGIPKIGSNRAQESLKYLIAATPSNEYSHSNEYSSSQPKYEFAHLTSPKDELLLAQLGSALKHDKANVWLERAIDSAGRAHRHPHSESNNAVRIHHETAILFNESPIFAKLSSDKSLKGKDDISNWKDGTESMVCQYLNGDLADSNFSKNEQNAAILYEPKLILGCNYFKEKKFNQAMHHFKIAAKTCPGTVYSRYLRECILDTALHAQKLEQLIEIIDEQYGISMLESLVGVEASGNGGNWRGSANGDSIVPAPPAFMRQSLVSRTSLCHRRSCADPHRQSDVSVFALARNKDAITESVLIKDWIKFECSRRLLSQTPTETYLLDSVEKLVKRAFERAAELQRQKEKQKEIAQNATKPNLKEIGKKPSPEDSPSELDDVDNPVLCTAQYFRASAICLYRDHVADAAPKRRVVLANWLREEERFSEALEQYLKTGSLGKDSDSLSAPPKSGNELQYGEPPSIVPVNAVTMGGHCFVQADAAKHPQTLGSPSEDGTNIGSNNVLLGNGSNTIANSIVNSNSFGYSINNGKKEGQTEQQQTQSITEQQLLEEEARLEGLAHCARKTGDHNLALQCYRELIRRFPEGKFYIGCLYYMAIILFKKRDLTEAIIFARRVIVCCQQREAIAKEQKNRLAKGEHNPNLPTYVDEEGNLYQFEDGVVPSNIELAIANNNPLAISGGTNSETNSQNGSSAGGNGSAKPRKITWSTSDNYFKRHSEFRLGAAYTAAKAHIICDDIAESQWMVKRGLEIRDKPEQVHFVFFLGLIKAKLGDFARAKELLVDALQLSNVLKRNHVQEQRRLLKNGKVANLGGPQSVDRCATWKLSVTSCSAVGEENPMPFSPQKPGVISSPVSSNADFYRHVPQSSMSNVMMRSLMQNGGQVSHMGVLDAFRQPGMMSGLDDRDSKICVDIRYTLAQLYLSQNDSEQARQEVEIGLTENPQHAGLLSIKAVLYVLDNDCLEHCSLASDMLLKLVGQERNKEWLPLLYLRLGYVYLRGGQYQEAAYAFAKSTRCEATHTCVFVTKTVYGAAHLYVAIAYSKMKDPQTARKHLVDARKYFKAFDTLVVENNREPFDFCQKLHELSLTADHIACLIQLLDGAPLPMGSGNLVPHPQSPPRESNQGANYPNKPPPSRLPSHNSPNGSPAVHSQNNQNNRQSSGQSNSAPQAQSGSASKPGQELNLNFGVPSFGSQRFFSNPDTTPGIGGRAVTPPRLGQNVAAQPTNALNITEPGNRKGAENLIHTKPIGITNGNHNLMTGSIMNTGGRRLPEVNLFSQHGLGKSRSMSMQKDATPIGMGLTPVFPGQNQGGMMQPNMGMNKQSNMGMNQQMGQQPGMGMCPQPGMFQPPQMALQPNMVNPQFVEPEDLQSQRQGQDVTPVPSMVLRTSSGKDFNVECFGEENKNMPSPAQEDNLKTKSSRQHPPNADSNNSETTSDSTIGKKLSPPKRPPRESSPSKKANKSRFVPPRSMDTPADSTPPAGRPGKESTATADPGTDAALGVVALPTNPNAGLRSGAQRTNSVMSCATNLGPANTFMAPARAPSAMQTNMSVATVITNPAAAVPVTNPGTNPSNPDKATTPLNSDSEAKTDVNSALGNTNVGSAGSIKSSGSGGKQAAHQYVRAACSSIISSPSSHIPPTFSSQPNSQPAIRNSSSSTPGGSVANEFDGCRASGGMIPGSGRSQIGSAPGTGKSQKAMAVIAEVVQHSDYERVGSEQTSGTRQASSKTESTQQNLSSDMSMMQQAVTKTSRACSSRAPSRKPSQRVTSNSDSSPQNATSASPASGANASPASVVSNGQSVVLNGKFTKSGPPSRLPSGNKPGSNATNKAGSNTTSKPQSNTTSKPQAAPASHSRNLVAVDPKNTDQSSGSSAYASTAPKNHPGQVVAAKEKAAHNNSKQTKNSNGNGKNKRPGPPTRRPKVSLGDTQMITHSDLTYGAKLGCGGFGTVYYGLYEGLEVAIKKINIDEFGGMSDTQIQEMEKEIEALSKLKHPRLVKFVGASLDYPNFTIVTEFMAGGSLHALLHINRVKLAYDEQFNMALQFAEGVQFLHNQKPRPIVHRDLKSLNIVLDRCLNCKICDFGLTRTMDKTHLSLKDGGNGGSPRYMALECYETNGKLTEKVDTWAAGCILNEIFGGSLPFEDCTQIQHIVKRLLVDRQGPAIARHISEPVRAIIQKCLQFDIAARSSADEIYRGLLEVARKQGMGQMK